MSADAVPWEEERLTPEQRLLWRADIAALRDFRDRESQLALRMGDHFNELKARWGKKMPALAQEAGIPYHLARQRAHIAERLPPESRLRTLGLPLSILRLLAPLPEPDPWAEKAKALQEARKLKVREFARMLEAAGLRQPRARKLPRCLHCRAEVADTTVRLYFRQGDTAGWLCNRRCALAFLETADAPEPPSLPDPSNPSDPSDEAPNPNPEDSESQNRNTESQNAGPAATDRSRPRSAAGHYHRAHHRVRPGCTHLRPPSCRPERSRHGVTRPKPGITHSRPP